MIAAYLMILTENSPTHNGESYFSHQKGRRSKQVHFYLGLSSFLVLLLSADQCRIEARTAQKAH